MTGHKSRELKKYQHLSPTFKQQTVELIAQELNVGAGKFTGTPTDTVLKNDQLDESQTTRKSLSELAEPTGLEPATSDVTGRRSNQLNYDSAFRQICNVKCEI